MSIFGTWWGKDFFKKKKKNKPEKLIVILALEKLKQELYELQAVLSSEV